jgi:hypothetical protein
MSEGLDESCRNLEIEEKEWHLLIENGKLQKGDLTTRITRIESENGKLDYREKLMNNSAIDYGVTEECKVFNAQE